MAYLSFGFVLDLETGVSGERAAAGGHTFGMADVCAVVLAVLRRAGQVPRTAAERHRGMLLGQLVLMLLSLVTVRVAAGSWALARAALVCAGRTEAIRCSAATES